MILIQESIEQRMIFSRPNRDLNPVFYTNCFTSISQKQDKKKEHFFKEWGRFKASVQQEM